MIVVIAILASIPVVAYNGVQDRANISRSLSDLGSLNKTVNLYYAENGSYPNTGMVWLSNYTNPNDYIPGVIPSIVSQLPQSKFATGGLTGSYMYRSNGTDYKVVAHTGKYSEYCWKVKASNPQLQDPLRDCWAYGYWSSGASSF